MEDVEYPTADEVDELLDRAEDAFGKFWDRHSLVRPLLFAAPGCKAEAKAYAELAKALG